MNPNTTRPPSNRTSFLSPGASANAPSEGISDTPVSAGLAGRVGASTPSLRSGAPGSTAYSQYYPIDPNYAPDEEDEVDTSATAHHMKQLMRNPRSQRSDDSSGPGIRSHGNTNEQDDIATTQGASQTSQTQSGRRYTHAPQRQSQHQSPALPTQQRRLPSFSPTMQAPPHSSQLVRASATSGASAQHHSSSTTSLAASGPLDFHKLISVLERRERRLETEAVERLELEKRRFEFTEVMEQKRLEIEQARYKSEKERTKRIENILMSLVSRTTSGGTGLASIIGGDELGGNAESSVTSDVSN